MRKILVTILAFSVIAGCNTVEGLGKDIKQGGAAIEKAAK